jgi:hypothetical protein
LSAREEILLYCLLKTAKVYSFHGRRGDYRKFPTAKKYRDYRKLLENKKGESFCSNLPAQGGLSSSGSFQCELIGRHTFQMVGKLQIYSGQTCHAKASTLLYESDVLQDTMFEVLPVGTTDDIKIIHNPLLTSQLKSRIRPDVFKFSHDRKGKDGQRISTLLGRIDFKDLPVNIAFQIIARVDGKDYPAGSVYVAKGNSLVWAPKGGWEYKGPPVEKMDIILRSSAEVARGSVDLFEIWDGELVYKDVPVKIMSSATAPSQ